MLLDLNADWSVAATYLNGPGIDNHLRQTSATAGISYYLTDHLGSTSGLTDSSGNIVEQIAYDSFGNSAGSAFTRYTYTGRERDPDTGILYYRTRSYDPQIGRFISEDPIGLVGGLNEYAYVENQPTNAIDPLGLQRLAPLGPRTTPRGGISRAELEARMTPRGVSGLPEDVRSQLDRGCIGLINCYLGRDPNGNFHNLPQDFPDTKCYLEINLAKSRKCPRCCRNVVYGIQGKETYPGAKIVPNGRGEVGKNLVSMDNKHIGFNFVMWFPSTGSYGYMDWGNGIREAATAYGRAYIESSPPPGYPLTIWCSHCKPIRR